MIRWIALAACFTVLLVTGHARAQTPSERARTILAEPAFEWCHHPGRFLGPSERPYCGYVDARSACPEFARACDETLRPATRASCSGGSLATIESAGRILVIGLVIGVALALIAWIVRTAARARRDHAVMPPALAPAEHASIAPLSSESAAELLARARDLASRGQYGPALFALYAALLRGFDERGVIRIDPSFTSGDYVRSCTEASLRAPLREVSREVERVRFGGASVTAERFERMLARVEPLLGSAAVIAFVVMVSVAGCARPRAPLDDHGPGGHHAARQVLTEVGIRTTRMIDAPEDVRDTARVVVLDGNSASLDESQWTALLAWVDRGGALVVAGGIGDVRGLGTHMREQAHSANIAMLDVRLGAIFVELHASTHALVVPADAVVLARYLSDDDAYAARVNHGRGQVMLIAGPELIRNAGLAVGHNADALVALFRDFAGDREVEFVEDTEGAATDPLTSLARAGALPAVLQGLVALALFFVLRGRHLGTPRDPELSTRRAFAEHVRALGGLYARAHASQRVVHSYGRLVVEKLRERLGSQRNTLSDAIGARIGVPAVEVEATLGALERAQQSVATPRDEAEHLRIAARLNEWWRRLG